MNELSFYRGDTVRTRVLLKDKTNDPIDITDSTIKISVRKELSDDSPILIQKDLEIVDEENGIALIYLTSSETKYLLGDYVFDLEMTSEREDEEDDVKTLIKCKMKVLQDVG